MSTRLRLGAVLLALPLALTACAGQEPDSSLAAGGETPPAAPSVTDAPSPVPTTVPTAPAATTAPTAAAADDAKVVDLTVAGGTVSGDTGRVPVERGARVRVVVTADVVDEVHVHGYDLHADTAVGRPATVEFVADQPGVYEVELEESRVLLTRLQVQ